MRIPIRLRRNRLTYPINDFHQFSDCLHLVNSFSLRTTKFDFLKYQGLGRTSILFRTTGTISVGLRCVLLGVLAQFNSVTAIWCCDVPYRAEPRRALLCCVLCCTMLYCAVCCTVSCCAVLCAVCCAVLCCTVLCCAVLRAVLCSVLHCDVMCAVLCCAILYYAVLCQVCCTVLCCVEPCHDVVAWRGV